MSAWAPVPNKPMASVDVKPAATLHHHHHHQTVLLMQFPPDITLQTGKAERTKISAWGNSVWRKTSEIKRTEEVELDPHVSPEEIMSREVELDPQVSPEEIMSREVELDLKLAQKRS